MKGYVSMKYDDTNKVYLQIGSIRLLDIRVFLDDIEIYSGMAENAPEKVKNLYYSKTLMTDKYEFYTYSKFNL